jgi:hypothetical protein
MGLHRPGRDVVRRPAGPGRADCAGQRGRGQRRGRPGLRPVIIALGAALVLSAPVALINPDRIYSFLIKPSLVALWLSQLIVFAVYPRFARRQHDRRLPAWALTVAASAFALYGLWVTIQHSAT